MLDLGTDIDDARASLLRPGHVTIDRSLIYDHPGVVRRILRDFLVIHIETSALADTLTYFGWHPAFDEVGKGEKAPAYTAEFALDREGNPSLSWRRRPSSLMHRRTDPWA